MSNKCAWCDNKVTQLKLQVSGKSHKMLNNCCGHDSGETWGTAEINTELYRLTKENEALKADIGKKQHMIDGIIAAYPQLENIIYSYLNHKEGFDPEYGYNHETTEATIEHDKLNHKE